jgi:drug/metabolite transporter (DMT)-like permease
MNRIEDGHVLPAAVRGAAWMILAAFSYAMTGVMVRQLADGFSVFEVAFFRCVIAVLMIAPLVLRSSAAGFRTNQLPMHVWRVALTYAGIMCWFYGVSVIPLSDYYALQFTLPLFSIAGAVLFLGQRADARTWLAVGVGFFGALIILRPGVIAVSFGALAAVGAAVLFAGVNTCVKVLSRREDTNVIMFYANVLIIPISLVPALFDWRTPDWADWPWLIGVGVFGTVAQYAITRAIAAADARVVQPFDFTRLPFAAALGYVFFGEVSDVWTWIGAVVIFGAGYYALAHERAASKQGG